VPTKGQGQLTELLEKEKARFIDLQFVDILGMVKSVTLTARRFKQGLEVGEWFDGSAIEGLARVSETDMYLKPDPVTATLVPWLEGEEKTARVICDVYTPKGEPFEGDPRAVLRRVTAIAEEAGFSYRVSPEVEFYLFEASADGSLQPVTRDVGGYFDRSADRDRQVREEIVKVLESMGVEVEASHHEVAPGQHEIDLYPQTALASADAVATLRWVARSVAQRHGLHASFMPKPLFNKNGSGMHIHQSLVAMDSGKDLFADPSRPYGLSALAGHFIAGQLDHARAIAAVLAPLVNSYKRLVVGYEAPTNLTWARANRSALIRVPERAAREAQATRVELRLPDSSCNPYLAYAAMLGTGLDGIQQELPLPEPIEELSQVFDPARRLKFNVATLPANLSEALSELEADNVIQDILGTHLLEHFVDAKRIEWENYRIQVTPWELGSYLPLY
jgi:glutamine synthetase